MPSSACRHLLPQAGEGNSIRRLSLLSRSNEFIVFFYREFVLPFVRCPMRNRGNDRKYTYAKVTKNICTYLPMRQFFLRYRLGGAPEAQFLCRRFAAEGKADPPATTDSVLKPIRPVRNTRHATVIRPVASALSHPKFP
jgi:hypothetical protein